MHTIPGLLFATLAFATVPGAWHGPDLHDSGLERSSAPVRRTLAAQLTSADADARPRAACEVGLTGAPGAIPAIPALIGLLGDDVRGDAVECEGRWQDHGIPYTPLPLDTVRPVMLGT